MVEAPVNNPTEAYLTAPAAPGKSAIENFTIPLELPDGVGAVTTTPVSQVGWLEAEKAAAPDQVVARLDRVPSINLSVAVESAQ